jgi:hypothetical protein
MKVSSAVFPLVKLNTKLWLEELNICQQQQNYKEKSYFSLTKKSDLLLFIENRDRKLRQKHITQKDEFHTLILISKRNREFEK